MSHVLRSGSRPSVYCPLLLELSSCACGVLPPHQGFTRSGGEIGVIKSSATQHLHTVLTVTSSHYSQIRYHGKAAALKQLRPGRWRVTRLVTNCGGGLESRRGVRNLCHLSQPRYVIHGGTCSQGFRCKYSFASLLLTSIAIMLTG